MAVQSFGGSWIARGVHQTLWVAMANGDTGAPQSNSTLPLKCFALTGTFGVGGSCRLMGSQDGTTWMAVKDREGNAVVLTAAGSRDVTENPRFMRPEVTAGDGTTALVASLIESDY